MGVTFLRPPVSFTPADLGASLLAWWDAERSDLITHSAGAVSSWRDIKAGYNAIQASGTLQPVYSATSFNGRPGITSDGTDDELTLAPVPAGIPTGATPVSIWAAVNQTALPADTTDRRIVGWGAAGSISTVLRRLVVSAQNRVGVSVGDGVTAPISTLTADFSGRHGVAGHVTGTTIAAEMDGVSSTPVACVPAINNSRLRLFAGCGTTAANWWQGSINTVLITAPLTAGQATSLRAWLTARL